MRSPEMFPLPYPLSVMSIQAQLLQLRSMKPNISLCRFPRLVTLCTPSVYTARALTTRTAIPVPLSTSRGPPAIHPLVQVSARPVLWSSNRRLQVNQREASTLASSLQPIYKRRSIYDDWSPPHLPIPESFSRTMAIWCQLGGILTMFLTFGLSMKSTIEYFWECCREDMLRRMALKCEHLMDRATEIGNEKRKLATNISIGPTKVIKLPTEVSSVMTHPDKKLYDNRGGEIH
jgi:hypothetical protein